MMTREDQQGKGMVKSACVFFFFFFSILFSETQIIPVNYCVLYIHILNLVSLIWQTSAVHFLSLSLEEQ